MTIPTLAFLVIAVVLAITVGRIGTLLKDSVRKNSIRNHKDDGDLFEVHP